MVYLHFFGKTHQSMGRCKRIHIKVHNFKQIWNHYGFEGGLEGVNRFLIILEEILKLVRNFLKTFVLVKFFIEWQVGLELAYQCL